ncbi:MAG: hypothetical protein A3C71_00600 [Candidatus Yanofskybacteria bacterium RIFCSPHIGHO2_02_FULL_43_15c]|uniref:Uncharacterized protein n=1 Tax=Candidatus Yanofskybacteria bacterium RIFCSPHIGHO2_02_FULL_43_15c TaxID=1802679 RepID=A0A1F8FJX7_9BACT|nr:MAG: hypothetical protein A3C71_00600 [Candidatus Yanofskybacteria bacterium RIFCSPHIGHO2_02_FULL_43_15c]
MRLPRIFWKVLVAVFIIYFGFSVFMFFGKGIFCANLVTKSTDYFPNDVEGYLNYKMFYRKVCGDSSGVLSIFLSSVGLYYSFNKLLYSYVYEAKRKKS